MNRLYKRFFIFIIVVCLIAALYYFGFSSMISFQELKKHSTALHAFVHDHYLFSLVVFLGAFIGSIILALPLVALFSLAGGYLFGAFAGLLYSQVAASIGAICAFMLYRYFFYNLIHAKYHSKLQRFEYEVKENGASYLLMLNFLSVVPYFIINTIAVLADIDLKTVAWTTAVGTFTFLLVYVLAGSQLATVNSMQDLMSARMLAVLLLCAVLAVIPIVVKRLKKTKHDDVRY